MRPAATRQATAALRHPAGGAAVAVVVPAHGSQVSAQRRHASAASCSNDVTHGLVCKAGIAPCACGEPARLSMGPPSSRARPQRHRQRLRSRVCASAASSGSASTAVVGSLEDGSQKANTGGSTLATVSGAAGAADSAAAQAPLAPPVALQPVTFTQTHVLAPQPCWQQAAAALRQAVAAELPRLAALSSGVVRWEVPLPRGCSAARWLRGQDAGAHHQVYFAGRHSTAPETPKSALAEASARGWSAAAGLGAAWLWRGAEGVPFGDAQLTGVQRMLSEAQPRIRVLGGTRWGHRVGHGPATVAWQGCRSCGAMTRAFRCSCWQVCLCHDVG